MVNVLTSKLWYLRFARIALLSTLGWWAYKNIVLAQLPVSIEWPKTNFDKSNVDMNEILSGGPPKDGIPPIDEPKFVSPDSAAQWLDPREPVVVVVLPSAARAYPIQILTWHEIVNDTLAGVPVSVTFCPLCNAAIVFDRRIDGKLLDFGTTGRLRNSDLIMYDRQTESWWQQFTGRAIIGDMLDTVLKRIPASIIAFEDFRKAYPNATVLSRDTGHNRSYGNNPYAGYDSIDRHPFLFAGKLDGRLPAMERVLNISLGDNNRLYPFQTLDKTPVINDEVNQIPVVVFSKMGTLSALDDTRIKDSRTIASATAWNRKLGDRVLNFELRKGAIIDRETQSQWNLLGSAVSGTLAGQQLKSVPSGVHFAFAWLAFNPDSSIYRQP